MSNRFRLVARLLSILGVCLPVAPPLSAQEPAPRPPVQQPDNRIVLTLTEQQEPSINGLRLRWEELPAQLHAIYGLRPTRILFVKVHPRNTLEAVSRVMALAKQEGITLRLLADT